MDSVIDSDLSASKRVGPDADRNHLGDGIDVHRGLCGPRYRRVAGAVEERFDLHDSTANPDPVEQIAGPWHGDGGEHAQDADDDDDLYDSERVSHRCVSFPLIGWLDSI
jgi:hypothetical protein